MNNQFISVVIPVYNMDVELFNRAIKSIKFNCEIIVVNDGSDPKYNYVCPGANFINLENNVGHLHARRIGVENATGDWIIFLDADDELNDKVQEVLDQVKDDHEKYGFNYNILVTDGDRKVKDETRYGYVLNTEIQTMVKDFLDSRNYIDPFVTGKIWKRDFLIKVLEYFKDYPRVGLGEDHLIMIKALESEDVDIYCTDESIYVRHEPHTCKKLNVSASIDDKITVFENMQVFRDSLRRVMPEVNDEDLYPLYESLSFRLSTCRIPMTQDFIDYLTRNGYNTNGIKPVRRIRYIDNEDIYNWFRYHSCICKDCYHYNDDNLTCRYGYQAMVDACMTDRCKYSNGYTDFRKYFNIKDDMEVIAIADAVLKKSDCICNRCRYMNDYGGCDCDQVHAYESNECSDCELRDDNVNSKCSSCRYRNGNTCCIPSCSPESCNAYEHI